MLKSRRLEVIVFLCGAAVMILELDGSRILAPYLGTSLFVWTSLIGIVLGCLSLGYHLGGKISDQKPEALTFSRIILLSACFVAVTAAAGEWAMAALYAFIPEVRLGAVVASLLLFGPASVLLGMVSPYAVRLRLSSVQNSGSEVGRLYALSTLGSIAGTFLAGFVLVAYFSNTVILGVLFMLLVFASFLAHPEGWKRKVLVLAIGLIFISASAHAVETLRGPDFVDANTPYNRVWIYQDTDSKTGLPTRVMQTNGAQSSAMYLDREELTFLYNRFFRLARHFKPEIKKALMIGGAAYSYPRDFVRQYPDAEMDVVEIDPGLTKLAKKYFQLQDSPRLHIHHLDGRIFLNQAPKETYDVYFGDAFNSLYSLPFHLTTLEAVQAIYDCLKPGGAALVNLISAIEGDGGKFLRAEYHTFRKVFPQVYVFPVRRPDKGSEVQNLMLVALKTDHKPVFTSPDPELAGYLQNLWKEQIPLDMPVLTDDFAPVDLYIAPILPRRRTSPNPLWERIKSKTAQT